MTVIAINIDSTVNCGWFGKRGKYYWSTFSQGFLDIVVP